MIHKRISWNWENISKSGPKLGQTLWKIESLMKRCIGSTKTSEPFFAFSQDITMRKKWFISAFPEIEKISQNLGPKLGQTLWKIESLMKRCIGSTKPHRTVFRFFARYYYAEEVFHKCISWNWENTSKSGPKFRPKMLKNLIFNEKVHRIHKTSQNAFRIFARYYDAEEVIHKRISWNWDNI